MFSPPLGTPGGPALSPRCGASSPRWSHHPPPGWSSASSVSSYDSHRPAAWRSHQVIKGEEEGDEEDEITAVVRRPPVSAPPAATAATLDEWTCELWEDDPFARFNGRSPAACTGRPRRSVVASSSVPSPVAAALLTPTPAEAVLADAHREVASQVDVLQAVRSTWVSLMYMAAGQAAP